MRPLSTVALVTVVCFLSGCAMCAGTYDCHYAAYGSSRPRVDMIRGRVGSAFDDAGAVPGAEYVDEGYVTEDFVDEGYVESYPSDETIAPGHVEGQPQDDGDHPITGDPDRYLWDEELPRPQYSAPQPPTDSREIIQEGAEIIESLQQPRAGGAAEPAPFTLKSPAAESPEP